MKVLALTKYTPDGASSRYRFYQFVPGLAVRGIRVDVAPLLGLDYLQERIGAQRRRPSRLALAAGRRARDLISGIASYDLLWLQAELWPMVPAVIERTLGHANVPYVVDYDDAIFHLYDQHPSRVVRWLFSSKIDTVMRHARAVVAGNEYLALRARRAGARRTVVLPTAIDASRYPERQPQRDDGLVIGWIGSPTTERHLASLAEPLRTLTQIQGAEVRAIGVSERFDLPGVQWRRVPWSGEAEIAEMSRFAVGIMPLEDFPFARGKCGFKLVQYMGCWLPVVATPLGANLDIVVPGETGLFASSPREWIHALSGLARAPDLRARYGRAGHARMRARYSVDAIVPALAEVLRDAAVRRAPRRPAA